MSTVRNVRAPRGTELSCKGWVQEAAYRMIQNNLDPDNAEIPEQLVVYGGRGKAARDWASFDAILASLRDLENDQTLLVQSGKPVAVMPSHPDAPRVLIANSLLVPRWATWEHFDELDRKGLMMYGQMTAGSWIYIGTQGILQGTYETFAACARAQGWEDLRGKLVLTGGLGGMGGAQPLSVTMNEGVALCVEVDPHRIERRLETRYVMDSTDDLDEALRRCRVAQREGRRTASVWSATAPTSCPSCCVAARGSTSSPTRRARTTHCSDTSRTAWTCRRPRHCASAMPRPTSARPCAPCASTARPWSVCRRPGASSSTTATICAAWPRTPASTTPSPTPASCPPTSAICSARARVPSAGSH